MLDVVGGSVLEPHDAPKLLARRQLSGGGPHLLLDRILCRVGGLETLIGEELDSVVGDRIVRGGDHRPRPGGPVDGEERNRRCGDDTCERDLHSRRAEAREERTFQHRPAEARVASDHYLAAIRRQHEPGGTAQDEHEVRGEVAVGHAAHTVGTEEPRHGDIFPDRAARDGRGRWRVVDSGYPVTSIHHLARDPLRLSEVKLYAQTPRMRNGQILRDISTLAWVGLWTWVGTRVHDLVAALAGPGRAVESAGQNLSRSAAEAGSGIAGVPLVGDALERPFGALSEAGRTLQGAGAAQQEAIAELALWLGTSLALIPIASVVLTALGLTDSQVTQREAPTRAPEP